MDDFEQLWNNYQAQIRSENGVSERMQKEFWDIVYPLMLVNAKKIATEIVLTSEKVKKIEAEELINDGFLKLYERIKQNSKPLIFIDKSDFKGFMFKTMRHIHLPAKKKKYKSESDDDYLINYLEDQKDKKKKKLQYVGIDKIKEINSISEEYNLGDSLNNVKEYNLKDVFESFKKIDEFCYNLINLKVFNKLSYQAIAKNHIKLSILTLRKRKERCLDSLREFKNKYYLNFGL